MLIDNMLPVSENMLPFNLNSKLHSLHERHRKGSLFLGDKKSKTNKVVTKIVPSQKK
jgi:hypothetical protein